MYRNLNSIIKDDPVLDLSTYCHNCAVFFFLLKAQKKHQKNGLSFRGRESSALTCACAPGQQRPSHCRRDHSAPGNGGNTCKEKYICM